MIEQKRESFKETVISQLDQWSEGLDIYMEGIMTKAMDNAESAIYSGRRLQALFGVGLMGIKLLPLSAAFGLLNGVKNGLEYNPRNDLPKDNLKNQ